MTFITDTFNSSFLVYLAIFLLLSSIFVIYYESKIKEQNHKITSMLSLVSTLAEDMQHIKPEIIMNNHLHDKKDHRELKGGRCIT